MLALTPTRTVAASGASILSCLWRLNELIAPLIIFPQDFDGFLGEEFDSYVA